MPLHVCSGIPYDTTSHTVSQGSVKLRWDFELRWSRMRCVEKGQDMKENDSEATFKRMVAQVIRSLVPVPVHTDPTVKVKNLPPLTSLLSASHMYALDHAS
jgi:hypothetical protein